MSWVSTGNAVSGGATSTGPYASHAEVEAVRIPLATGSTTARSQADRFADVVNVKDFGAKGDGVTDDTAAIQAALTAGAGKTVLLPPGTHKISSALTVSAGTKVYGRGASSVVSLATGDISGFTATSVSNVEIHDLRITAPSAGTTAYIGGVIFDGCTSCVADGLAIDGMSWAGVYLNNAITSTVRNCRFSGWRGTIQDSADVMVRNTSINNLVTGNTLFGGGDHGVIVHDPAVGATPKGNTISNNNVGAHKAYGIAVYVTTHYDTQTVVSGNNVHDIDGAGATGSGVFGTGIYIQGANGSTVTGNKVTNCLISTTDFESLAQGGIGVYDIATGFAPVAVSGNVITAMPKGPGIKVALSSGGVSITGNVVHIGSSTAGHGIYLRNVSGCTVTGNRVNQTTSSFWGITAIASNGSQTSSLVFAGNHVVSSGYGLGLQDISGGFANAVISGNYVEAPIQACAVINLTKGSVTGNQCVSSDASSFAFYGDTLTNVRLSNNVIVAGGAGSKAITMAGTGSGNHVDDSNYYSGLINNVSTSGATIATRGTTAPATGTWGVGDTVWNTAPAAGGTQGWVCTTAGTSGTWKAMANLAP